MGDWLSDLDPRVELGAVMSALISGVAKAFGAVLVGELKLWLKEKMRRCRQRAGLTSMGGPRNKRGRLHNAQ
jgi:hypothetical protein